MAIDLGGLKETAAEFDEQMEQLAEVYKWVDTHHQLADHLTKQKPTHLLRGILGHGRIALKLIDPQDTPESHEFKDSWACNLGMRS